MQGHITCKERRKVNKETLRNLIYTQYMYCNPKKHIDIRHFNIYLGCFLFISEKIIIMLQKQT